MRGSHSCTLGIVGLVLLLSGGLSWAAGVGNTAYGIWALNDDTTGSYNSAFGDLALVGNTTGSHNTASGWGALLANGKGDQNTASGYSALYNNTGDSNAAFGYEAGQKNTAGSNNTFIGNQANANATSYTNGTALGNGATLTASNSIVLGNNAITKIYAKVTTITAISDLRRKKDIAGLPSNLGLEFIAKLKPVSYKFNDGDETERFGFIAQDIEQALPASLHDAIERSEGEHGLALIERQNDTDRTYRVSYGELFAPMVKAMQEQQQEIAAQRKEIADLRHSIEALKQRLAAAQ